MEHEQSRKLWLFVSIVDRGKGERLTELYQSEGIRFQQAFLGRGTANSEILEYFGLGETEKDLVVCSADATHIQRIRTRLLRELHFDRPGTGIAFSLPINSVGGPKTLQLLQGLAEREE